MDPSGRPESFYATPVSKRLVDLIEHGAKELTHQWVREVRTQDSMPHYRAQDEEQVFERAFRVYSQLGRWLSQDMTKAEIRDYWMALGRERCREGYALSEIIQALSLIRRHLWIKVDSEGLLDTALDLRHGIELFTRVLIFFDRAIYYAVIGYEAAEPEAPPRR
jgi:hypothetical protein